jgi:hypothetical protein
MENDTVFRSVNRDCASIRLNWAFVTAVQPLFMEARCGCPPHGRCTELGANPQDSPALGNLDGRLFATRVVREKV